MVIMKWLWKSLKQSQILDYDLTVDKFWEAVNVWNTKPHLLIKHLMGAEKLFDVSLSDDVKDILSILSDQPVTWYESPKNTLIEFKLNKGHDIQVEVWKLLTKKPVDWNDYLRLSVFIKKTCIAEFYDFTPKCGQILEPYAYSIQFSNGQLELKLGIPENSHEVNEKMMYWLTNQFFPKFLNWVLNDNGSKSTIKSLSLICINDYCHLYNNLKEKYAKALMDVWTEVTDPKKYIPKDIATASYLILLWGKSKPTFVDMGCGNGLLVHILNSEGYRGFGVDIRSRNMWAQYPETTVLKVTSIDPSSSECKFPEVDWIIGNHSDELSPWVPIIASRSNYNCKFFLLPCCTFELNGLRYQRHDSSLSQYHDYLKYLENTCIDIFKFEIKVDRLRIPSTKRICLIGWSKKYNQQQFNQVVQDIENFAKSKFNENVKFIPRPSIEKVRNCTKLDRDLVQSVVNSVVEVLLKHPDQWACRVSLRELANEIGAERLKKLKKECGGLQTLLRNHRYIFIVEKGSVGFRKPTKNEGKVWKKHKCWFYHNFPDKCPLNDNECYNIH
ncbi:probable tRNA (uracil-O(2)-)-methyltransferase [Daktulosphaira vitifoliae]|uniref:probable tRNA (uracil-O(2)-)-methyltransferase n=1 Tax=Daktulosphaira vitifoliae TaxID=58002 RepID=UPI0021AB0218|nr:probable tRNA (uracil-O(2)-)-methyltransferase [Daktulosphaira vitifoliae]